jgi:hypothetical protein
MRFHSQKTYPTTPKRIMPQSRRKMTEREYTLEQESKRKLHVECSITNLHLTFINWNGQKKRRREEMCNEGSPMEFK